MVALSQNKIELITLELEQLIGRTWEAKRIDDFYVFSYPHLLAGGGRLVSAGGWSVDEVTRRLTTVYGWMPCSPKSHNEAAMGELVLLLNVDASLVDIMPVASRCLSNSLVAASKFMHWARRETAPMFDCNLEARYWPETRSRLSYLPTAVRRYFEWTSAIDAVSPELKARARSWAHTSFGYDVTAVRAIEAMAFYAAADTPRGGSPPYLQLRITHKLTDHAIRSA